MRKKLAKTADGLVLKVCLDTEEIEEMIKKAVINFEANLCGDCPHRRDKNGEED